eukprot:jgi/Galph1/3460/GphlegSOOS_G2162.1
MELSIELESNRATVTEWLEKSYELKRRERLEDCRTLLEACLAFFANASNESSIPKDEELLEVRAALTGCYIMLSVIKQDKQHEDYQKLITEQLSILDSQMGPIPRLLELFGWRELLTERYDHALRYFDRIPNNSKGLICLLGSAIAYFYKGVVHTALDTFRSVIHRWRRCEIAWMGIGRCFAVRKNYGKAQKALSRAIEITNEKKSPVSVIVAYESKLLMALIALSQGTAEGTEAGLNILKELYRSNSASGQVDARVVNRLAEYLFYRKEYKRASVILNKMRPTDVKIPLSKGEMLFQKGRLAHVDGELAEAENLYTQALLEAGDLLPQARLALGSLYLSRQDYQAALDCFERILTSIPECMEAKAGLGVLLTIGEMKNLDFTMISPERDSYTRYELRKMRKERAVSLLQDVCEKNNKSDFASLVCLAYLLEVGDSSKACSLLERSLSLLQEIAATSRMQPPIRVRILNNLAALKSTVGHRQDAESILFSIFNLYKAEAVSEDMMNEDLVWQIVSENPTIPVLLLYNMALLWELESKKEQSKKLYWHIVSQYGDYPDALFRLGYLSFSLNNYAEAKEFYERGSKYKPGLGSHLLATLARAQGNYYEYQSLLERSLQSRQLELSGEAADEDYSYIRLCNFYIDCSQVVDEKRQQKFLDKCLELLQRVLSRFPFNAYAANAFGIYLSLRETYSEAREVFHALVGTPAAEMAKLNLAHVQVQLAKKLINSSGDKRGFNNAAANVALSSAAKLYEDSVLQNASAESRSELMLYQSQTHFEQGNFFEAAKLLKRLIHLLPMYVPLWFNWALALEECALSRIQDTGKEKNKSGVSLKGKPASLTNVTNARLATAEFGRAYRIFQAISRRKLSADGEGIVRQTPSSRMADAHHTFCKSKRASTNVLLANAEKEYLEQVERFQERQRSLEEKLASEEKKKVEEEKRRQAELAALEERERKFQESLKRKLEQESINNSRDSSRKKKRQEQNKKTETIETGEDLELSMEPPPDVMEEIFGE